jgi:hypothetical protein
MRTKIKSAVISACGVLNSDFFLFIYLFMFLFFYSKLLVKQYFKFSLVEFQHKKDTTGQIGFHFCKLAKELAYHSFVWLNCEQGANPSAMSFTGL